MINKTSIRLLAAGLLFTTILVLAYFQYHWINEVSEAQVSQMRKNTERSLGLFIQELDGTLTELYKTFRLPASNSNNEIAFRVAENLRNWKLSSKHPDLLSEVYFVQFIGNEPLIYRISKDGQLTLLTTYSPLIQNHLADLRSLYAQGILNDFDTYCHLAIDLIPIPVYLFLPPLPNSSIPNLETGLILLELNSAFITNSYLPNLKKAYLPDDQMDLALFSSRSLQEPYFSSSPTIENYNSFDVKAPFGFLQYSSSLPSRISTIQSSSIQKISIIAQQKSNQAVISKKDTTNTRKKKSTINYSFSFSETAPAIKDSSFFVGFNSYPQKANVLLSPAPDSSAPKPFVIKTFYSQDRQMWEMRVRHREGSFEIAAKSLQRKNFFISFGILAVLGLSIGLLVLSAERAQKLAERQMEFVAGVSHELRTPLAVIQSAGENLADGITVGEENTAKYGELIKSEGKRLAEMVEEILEFAGVESGKKSYRFEVIDLKPVILEIISEFEQTALKENIRFEATVPETLKPLLLDRKSFRSAVMNLLHNALKYSNGKSPIILTISELHSSTLISVKDFGLGISKEDQAHIFEPFYRAKSVRDAQIKGNGLGLSLVKRIMDAHKGKVFLESELHRGSNFTLLFPNG
ncbi:MAG: HAMP domain-containing sensor histidine kinase [Chloroherpetonaceae bacterium]|nr:HAMP domain-containing sensor histidine kinase [Chloroherpetonaceae bacterium]